jgi:large subunit ribosomal protein L29
MRDLTGEELRQKMSETREELFKLRLQKSVGEIEQPMRIRTLRRDVARMLTVMKERGIA